MHDITSPDLAHLAYMPVPTYIRHRCRSPACGEETKQPSVHPSCRMSGVAPAGQDRIHATSLQILSQPKCILRAAPCGALIRAASTPPAHCNGHETVHGRPTLDLPRPGRDSESRRRGRAYLFVRSSALPVGSKVERPRGCGLHAAGNASHPTMQSSWIFQNQFRNDVPL